MAAMKLLMKERGKFHVSMDIGCNLLVPYHHSMLVIPFWDMGCPWLAAAPLGRAWVNPTLQ